MHEPEEYVDLIRSSSCVVTASAQTALEAKVSGAKVIYLSISENDFYPVELLELYGINIVNGFDAKLVEKYLEEESAVVQKKIERFDEKKMKSIL